MTSIARMTLAVLIGGTLAGCGGGGGGNNQNFTVGQVRVINAISDAPTLSARIGAGTLATVSFGQASRVVEVGTGAFDLDFAYTAPDGDAVTVLDNRDLPVTKDRLTTAVALGTLAQPTYLLIDEATPDVAAGQTEVQVLHGATDPASVDVYLTATAVDIAGVAPTVSVNRGAASGLSTVPAGNDYRLRVTAAGDKTVLFDSDTFTLDAATRRLFLVADYFGPGGSGLRAAIVDNASATTFPAEALPAAWRVANLVVDLTAIDVYAGAVAPPPTFDAVPEGSVAESQTAAPATFEVTVTPAGDAGTTVETASLALAPGQSRTLVVAGVDGTDAVTTSAVPDLLRPISGQAQVRVVHGSPAAGTVDFHVLATGTAPTATSADLAGLLLQSNGVVALEPGTHDVYFTATGAATVTVVAGPVPITVDAQGLYSIYLADLVGGGTPVRVILAEDFPG